MCSIRNVFVRTLEYRSTYKENAPLTDLCYCNNKKFYRNNTKRPVEYKWSLWQRVASSENETSESSRDNFSTSKPVDMFDSNLSQPLRGVDRPSPFFPSLQTLPTDEVANHDEIAFSTEKFCRSWQLSRRIWFTIVRRWKHQFWNVPYNLDTIMTTERDPLLFIAYYLWQNFVQPFLFAWIILKYRSGVLYFINFGNLEWLIFLLSCIFNVIQTFKL